MNVIGIDPGLSGAAVSFDGEEMELLPFERLSECIDLTPFRRFLVKKSAESCEVFMEKVHAMPKQGVSSMFKFGRTFGQLEGVLSGLMIPYHLVTPQTWQKVCHSGISGENAKAKSLEACRRLFPGEDFVMEGCRVPHDGVVDAALIAYYGWNVLRGRRG